MARPIYTLFALLAFVAACGSDHATKPDAPTVPDAAPPDAALPDALACVAPQAMCTAGMCTDTTTDEGNCGQCGMACQGGAFCGPMPTEGACQCPADFLPADLTMATLVAENQLHYLALIGTMTASNGVNAFVPVINTQTNVTGQDYTLSPPGGFPPSVPLIALAYGVNGQAADSEFVAVSGTVNFTTITCNAGGSELKGTLTGVMFQGAIGNLQTFNIMVDPAGCTFTIDTMTFDITSSSACS